MAARFWVAGGNGNWNSTTNWSTTSGGASGAALPTAADDVTFDGAGNGNCTVNVAGVCLSLTITAGYTSTITFVTTISVSGNITLNTGVTFAGSGALRMGASGTFTSNGKTINVPVSIGFAAVASITCTLGDALNIAADLTINSPTSTTFVGAFDITANSCTITNTQTVTLSGNVTINGTTTNAQTNVLNGAFTWKTLSLTMSAALTGTAAIEFFGTGTWQSGAATATLALDATIAAGAGTLTISGNVPYGVGTLTYTSGTVVTTGSTLSLASSCTLDTAGITWNNVTLLGTATITITNNSHLTVSGTLTYPNAVTSFLGTDGWTTGTFTNTAISTRVWTFAAGETYTITSAFTHVRAVSAQEQNHPSFVSSSPGTAVNFVLQAGASQDVGFVDPTDMDASAGEEIFTFHGVITSSPNWTNVYSGGGGGSPTVHAYAYAG